jgi:hypothetical protein
MIQVVEKPIVKEITLEIGNKEIKLSLEEAKNLHRALADLLNEPKITVTPYYPWPWYQPSTITYDGASYGGVSVYCTDTTKSLLQ